MQANHNLLDIQTVAIEYHEKGFSVVACDADKRPNGQWQQYIVKHDSSSHLISLPPSNKASQVRHKVIDGVQS